MTLETEKVRYEVSGSVALVTIARPDVRNAMDMDVFDGLTEAGERAGGDRSVRAVVVVGEGANFSSGIDTSVFTGGDIKSPAEIDIARLQRSFTVYEQMLKPTIAAVAGPTFGAGIQLAIACDFRVAGADVELSVMETKWGIIPDLGGTQRLPRLIGLGRAKELAMTARRVGADEAMQIGLVNKVVPSGEHLSASLAWAAELAGGPPLALAAIKRLANSAFDSPVGPGLGREAAAQRRILASKDFVEAVTARMQKREPRFEAQ
jgi:enoyl-CoA hydratase/carnithine racemase